jgi:hypothetical protein
MMRIESPRLGLAAVLALAGAVSAVAGCRERSRPDPQIQMAVSHEAEEPASAASPHQGGGAPGGNPNGAAAPEDGRAPAAPTRLEVPPEVQQAWSGIRLHWKDLKSGGEGTLDVPLGDAKPLPDPTMVVRGDVFLPAFTMTGGAITSQGTEPQNPAARITVFEKGKEVFGGWIFTRFPDVHPFTHPKYQLRLEGGVPRAKS